MNRRDFLTILVSFGSGAIFGKFLSAKLVPQVKKRKTSRGVVVKENCAACGGCVAVCPQGAIEFPYPGLLVDQMLCNRCGNCVKVCPVGAIEFG